MAKVASIIDGSSWRWPLARSATLLELAHTLPLDYVPCSSREDELIWEDDSRGIFSVKSAWEALRPRGNRVSWSRVVWFRKAIPRHAFILWLAIQGGLYTRDRLMAFGISDRSTCVFCSNSREDTDHLFFQCTFSSRIWSSILAKCGIVWHSYDWPQTVSWMEQHCSGSLYHLIIRLSFAAAVYFIWRERNARLHGEPPHPPSVILSDIISSVRTRVSLLKNVKPSYDNRWLHHSWHLSDDIF